MGQEDVLVLLKRHRRWLTTNEIIEKLERGKCSAPLCLRKLYEHGLVQKSDPTERPCRWRIAERKHVPLVQ